MSTNQELLFAAMKASVLTAAALIKGEAGGDKQFEDKGENERDVVSSTDRNAEGKMRAIMCAVPGVAFYGEESHKQGEKIDPHKDTAVVDPLDGSTNDKAGIPLVASSVGILRNREVVAGAVSDVNRYCRGDGEEHIYFASKGHGAFLGKEVITVSRCVSVSGALVGLDWPNSKAPRRRRAMLHVLDRIGVHCRNIRVFGTAVLALCYVADGTLDAYVNFDLFAWDVAAAKIIIEEAGGKVTDAYGNPWTPCSRTVIATNGNPVLHAKLVKEARRALRPKKSKRTCARRNAP